MGRGSAARGGNGPYRARSHMSSRGAVANCSLRQGRGGALRLKTRKEGTEDAGGATPLPRARWQCGMGPYREAAEHCPTAACASRRVLAHTRRAGVLASSHKASRRACCQASC